jgi:hypothetical protein
VRALDGRGPDRHGEIGGPGRDAGEKLGGGDQPLRDVVDAQTPTEPARGDGMGPKAIRCSRGFIFQIIAAQRLIF